MCFLFCFYHYKHVRVSSSSALAERISECKKMPADKERLFGCWVGKDLEELCFDEHGRLTVNDPSFTLGLLTLSGVVRGFDYEVHGRTLRLANDGRLHMSKMLFSGFVIYSFDDVDTLAIFFLDGLRHYRRK